MAEIIALEDEMDDNVPESREMALVNYVIGRIKDAEDYRDTNFKMLWDEYYRLWRGIWLAEDKTRDSERSRLISPALQQAIEVAVSELEEATFGRGRWFDVSDDIMDQDKRDMEEFRNLMMEDLDANGVRSAMSEIFLNSSIYGTGIGKIVVEEDEERTIQAVPVDSEVEGVTQFEAQPKKVVKVRLVAVPPQEFVIDPSAKTVDDAHFCGHIIYAVPKHIVTAKQEQGIYEECDLGSYPDDEDVAAKGENKPSLNTEKVKLVEYHGLIPRDLLEVPLQDGEEYADLGVEDEEEGVYGIDEDDLVEAIVTVANDGVLLRAIENPYTMGDRCFIAYQHDTVPNRFWGRGVAEKGYNPQKALDAELRARMDGMALAIHPMMAIDATRIPRGGDMTVRPGKSILTNGDPRTVLMPFNFGNVGTNTFAQSGDLERMIQMGTGSMDSATPVGINPRNDTASGMSMMLSGAIKRSKRTLANIERSFTKPFIHKAAWRYMQFDPDRYPAQDVKFVVHSTLGIMARELEQQQLTGLLQTVPSDSPAFWMLIRSIYENSSISNRDQMIQIIEQMMQKILNPPPPQPTFDQQLLNKELEIKSANEQSRVRIELMRARAEIARLELQVLQAPSDIAKKEAEMMLTLAQADAEELGMQLNQYKTMADALIAESERNYGQAGRREV